jgi:hypothetical protein
MSIKGSFKKTSTEQYGVAVVFDNPDDPTAIQNVQSFVATAKKRSDGSDATSIVLNSANNTQTGNTAIPWVRSGTSGEYYDIKVVATLADSKTVLEQQLEMLIQDEQDAA